MSSGGESNKEISVPRAVVPHAAVSSPTHSYSFKIPMLPPSMNAIYGINYAKKQVFMNNNTRLFKGQAKMFIRNWQFNNDDLFKVEIKINNNWFTKNGKVKRADIHNMTKVIVDLTAERLGFDDSRVWTETTTKIQSKEQSIEVKLEKFQLNEQV